MMTAFLALGLCLLAEPIPKAESEGRIVIAKTSPEPAELFLLKSDGTVVKRFEPKGIEGHIHSVRISPDKSRVLLTSSSTITPGKPPPKFMGASGHLIDLNHTDKPAKMVFEMMASGAKAVWSADGQKLYVSELDGDAAIPLIRAKSKEPMPHRNWIVDLTSGKKERLEIPAEHAIFDVSPDGKTLLTGLVPNMLSFDDFNNHRAGLVSLDTLKPEWVSDKGFMNPRLSPDGKRILGERSDTSNPKQIQINHIIYNTVTKEEQIVVRSEKIKSLNTNCMFVKNGKVLAFVLTEKANPTDLKSVPQILRSRLCTEEPHGQNFKEIYKTEGLHRPMIFDWR